MKVKNFFADESAITISVETILMFSISIIFLGIIIQSFQGLNQKQNKALMEQEYLTVGNSIAKQMSEMTVEAMASLMAGSNTTIRSEIYMPMKIADTTYSARLKPGKLIIESTSDPYVSVEIPLSSDIIVTENSTIYSYNEKPVLEYDSKSGSIYFVNGGVTPSLDDQNPTISILSPPDGATIINRTIINVSVWDNVRVTRVEYYINGTYECSIGSPYNWTWNTRTTPNGNYTATAVAYDTAGNSAAASRNYTIDNGATEPPVITPLSPLSDTDFRKPNIQVRIADDLGINFSSIIFKVDNENRISDVTFANVSSKLTTLTYTPAENMPISPPNHSVEVSVLDTDSITHYTIESWSFAILPITDTDNPSTSIISPDASTILLPGSPIKVTYTAADNTSGIDNISIKVTRGDGATYFHNDTMSTVEHYLPPQTWTFTGDLYEAGMNYTYNIIVYDRGGNMWSHTVGAFTVRSGQAGQLEVDTSQIQSTVKTIKKLQLKDNVSDSNPVIITGVSVSWTGGGQIENVKIKTSNYWVWNGAGSPDGRQNTGTLLTFGSTYTASQAGFENMEITLDTNVAGKTFTIVFHLQDTSTRTVIFTV